MRTSRITSLVLLVGLLAGGLLLDAADQPTPRAGSLPLVEAGVAMPAAAPPGTLTSTWYCAGGTATDGGIADHVLLLANSGDTARSATVTVLTGYFAPPPPAVDEATGASTTEPAVTTTVPRPAPLSVELPPWSRAEVALAEVVKAPLAGAIVEIDGGEVAVEHQVTGAGGRATAPCSTTAAREWSFPWGVTLRGSRELLVFMNPFPDDATLDIDFATDEGTRDTLRFRGFVVPGRSVVGAFIDEDVTRKAQVSAQVHVRGGRVVADRIQLFDGTQPDLEGITLGLGAPVPAETWMFPDGRIAEGITERVVVFNPAEEVAEVEVEVRLDDPDTNGVREPFEITVPPKRFSIVDVGAAEDEVEGELVQRIPDGVAHSILVRSLNRVPVTVERVITLSEPNTTVGVSATLGAPLAAPVWLFPGGGVSEDRDEFITLLNASLDEVTTFSIVALAGGQPLAVEGLQGLRIPPAGRLSVRLSDHVRRDDLPLLVSADGPVVAERGLFRVGGRGVAQSMGIPLKVDVVVPEPVAPG